MNRVTRRAVLRALRRRERERTERPMGISMGAIHRERFDEEPEEWFDLRDLGGWDLRRAREERAREGRSNARDWGGDMYAVILKHWDAVSQKRESAAAQPVDHLNDYDLFTILEMGIVGWSYRRPREDGTPDAYGEPIPVTPDTIRKLHEDTQDRIARRILKLSGVSADPLPEAGATTSTPS